MIKEVLLFLKNPIYEPYSYLPLKIKGTIFASLLGLNLAISLCCGLLFGFISTLFDINLGAHGIDELFKEYNLFIVFLMAVILAPVAEELVFRGPLALFKRTRFFKYAFYSSAILFGTVHLSNFESLKDFLWLAPVLVAPQVFAGFFLGFIRVKLGLEWAMLLHACHNGIIIGPLLWAKLIGVPT